MEPTTEKPEDVWGRFREEKSLEELAQEQGHRPLDSIKDLYADIMPEDETPEMLIATVDRWRAEDRRRVVE